MNLFKKHIKANENNDGILIGTNVSMNQNFIIEKTLNMFIHINHNFRLPWNNRLYFDREIITRRKSIKFVSSNIWLLAFIVISFLNV